MGQVFPRVFFKAGSQVDVRPGNFWASGTAWALDVLVERKGE